MIRHIYKTAPLAALVLGSTCFGYIRETTTLVGDTSPAGLFRTDNTGIQFYLNSGVVAGAQSSASGKAVMVIGANSDPAAAIRAALATWNAVSTANIRFKPLQSTSSLINPYDNTMVIAIGSTADDLSFLGPALAVTVPAYNPVTQNLNGVSVGKGALLDTDIIINPAYMFSTDGTTISADGSTRIFDLQSVMLHEFGHSLGANHTGLLGASMFQAPNQHFLTADDVTFAAAVYPPAGGSSLGTISGTVTAGGAGVPYALLTAFDMTAGVTIGGATNPDGTYSFQVPAGTYQMYAEPLNGIQFINIYLTSPQVGAAEAVKFQTTMASGTYAVAANGTVTANIAATPGAATVATPYLGVGPTGTTPVSFYVASALTVPSGGAVDLVFAGSGFDAGMGNANFAVYGKGVTLRPGSVRVDKTATVAGNYLLRATLDVAATTTPSLASFTVTTFEGTISFSGSLVIVPPTPTFVKAAVISAAPYAGIPAGVSPGGMYSIYDSATSSLGPASYVSNGPFDAYGNLATILAGVSVTFDGVPAPMFLAYGPQINFQVPFEVAGKTSTKVVVNYLGSANAPVTVPVIPAQPGFFTLDGKAVIASNLADHTLNTAQNPAARGSYVEIYGTGVGKVSYAIATGQGAPAFPGGFNGNYTYSIGGAAAAPAYFGGWTPGTVGLAQWDLLVPANSATGAVSVVVTDASGAVSQPGATIYVK